ncbi:NAD(P)(+) transhydrogenase (Re/Si-specific) subunit beta [Miltoncostaea marina]|uniref:NAD(P)(+) transhydrogenase (Re/Si-specific) subunit beta n=1 Tax=Miltoncostaea marina TaxID=2843215 RepID=UPI001C3D9641|nr:NAD(P)(+) transhydrogenase (Re/Si-specific) subunit beta [Miltoncostaea marina]
MDRMNWIQLAYLVAALGFAFSLKWMSQASTARRGVLAGEIGFGIAIVATLFWPDIDGEGYLLIAVALLIGSAIGVPLGLLVPMTAMPQRIALSHAFGGLAAGLIGVAHFYLERSHYSKFDLLVIGIEITLGMLVFTGSLMAAGKLQEWLPQRPIVYPGQNAVNFAVLGAALALVIYTMADPDVNWTIPVVVGLGLAFGIFLIIPIGGADMPTVIALLNSYAGLSAAALGFVLDSKLLIVAGALDGASGLILSIIMCRAMNRSFTNVLFGAFGATDATAGGDGAEQGTYRTAMVDEAADLMKIAGSVVIVPGYGMAVAQAQHKVRELADALEKQGVDVKFAIHPVAGRMPGHMNVLLAEANVPYDQLLDMDEINSDFAQTDVVLVLGANDVVNPAARHDTSSPIYGMPILNVDQAQTIFVVKRSMRAGFAGIENELFFNEKTSMVFGDAKSVVTELTNEVAGQRDAISL